MLFETSLSPTIVKRNSMWRNNKLIPSWVNIDTVGLDQFYTKPEIAQYCYSMLIDHISKKERTTDDYTFVEPSAGECSFFNLLPKERRLGIDIEPDNDEIIDYDFLSWWPNSQYSKLAFIGNPPFGYRAWLALSFMNHTAKFADYVGYILPMAFQSEGKGSPKLRVKGLKLIHSEVLPPGSFYSRSGKEVKINALWQIWEKGINSTKNKKTCRKWLDLFTVDLRKERLCGLDKMSKADYFLQRTYFNRPPSLVTSFSQVKYVCGYGMIIKKNKSEIYDLFRNVNWDHYSNLAAHNCRHISMYHIEKVLVDGGYCDN